MRALLVCRYEYKLTHISCFGLRLPVSIQLLACVYCLLVKYYWILTASS